MSSAIYFLLGAVGFCIVGFLVLWMLHREPRATTDRSVTSFSGNLAAIAPKPEPAEPRRTLDSPIPGGMNDSTAQTADPNGHS